MSLAERQDVWFAPLRQRPNLARLHPRRLAGRALIIGAATTILAVSGSWIPSVWGDEATSILSAQRSLPSLFRMLGHVDAVHGTYYVLLHFWVAMFGASAFSVRVPSAIAVGIAAAGVVVLATRVAGSRVGVFAGIVFAVLPRTTYMGEEARGYAFSAAAAVWATVFLLRLLSSSASRRRDWAVYAVTITACGYIFLFSLLLLAAHAIVVLAYRHDLLRRWMIATGCALVLALPVIVYGVGEQGQIAFLSNRTAASFSSVAVSQWFGSPLVAVVAWTLITAAIALGVREWWRRTRHPEAWQRSSPTLRKPGLVLIAATWLIVPMAILLTVNSVHAVYSSRYLSFATPAAALLMGWFIGRIPRIWASLAAMVVVVAIIAPSYLEQRTVYAKNASDWSVDAAYIQSHASAGEGILFDESTRPSRDPRLAMAAYPASFAGLDDLTVRSQWWATNGWRDTVYPLDDVLSGLNGVGTVWLVEYRAAGTSGDSFDIDTLNDDGYSIVERKVEYRSVILELTKFD